MNQMPIMFSLQKAPEKLLFEGRREGSGARSNDKVSELDEVSNYGNGGYHQDRVNQTGAVPVVLPRLRRKEEKARPSREHRPARWRETILRVLRLVWTSSPGSMSVSRPSGARYWE
jgi:hypothetical protein